MELRQIFEKHPHWQAVVTGIRKITNAGYIAYLAGGCVRDALLGKSPNDFDVATSATPDEVAALFPKTIDVGREFGVMIVPFDGFQIEVTTFRLDGEYQDGRHPQSVTFSRPKEDALRRDFTVNAMFYDIKANEVIDYVSGLPDLQQRVLRAVGDPHRRFQEDKLRMLRAARFAAQLNFDVEERTLQAIHDQAQQIQIVSKERVTEEFKKLASAPAIAKGFALLKSTGLLQILWPSLGLVRSPQWRNFLRAAPFIATIGSLEMLLASLLLFELIEKENQGEGDLRAKRVSISWENSPFILSRESKREIEFLVHGFFVVRTGQDEGLLLLNEDLGPLLTEVCFIFTAFGLFPEGRVGGLIDRFLRIADESGRLPQPFLGGENLKAMGLKPSARMGEILRESYLAQIRGDLKSKAEAEKWAREQIQHSSS